MDLVYVMDPYKIQVNLIIYKSRTCPNFNHVLDS